VKSCLDGRYQKSLCNKHFKIQLLTEILWYNVICRSKATCISKSSNIMKICTFCL
jgi:hypothetical protein